MRPISRAITLAPLIALACLTIPYPLLAGPIPSPDDPFLLSRRPIMLSGFLLEGLLIALLARATGVRKVRFVAAWFVLTLVSCFVMTLMISYLVGFIGFQRASVVGELAVGVVEALCILLLLGSARFVRHPDKCPGIRAGFAYSLVANAASLGVGIFSAWR